MPSSTERWPLTRILMLILAVAFMGLVADLRVEHVDIVKKQYLGWIPIIYSTFMTLACVVAAILWTRLLRLILLCLFLLAFGVGGLGFWLHNNGNFLKVARTTTQAFTDPNMKHPRGPPQTAPLAFAGLGLLGLLACLKRFD